MEAVNSVYQMIRVKNENVCFSAAYAKYFMDQPYVALFEKYPAAQTRILVCQQVSEESTHYGLRLCKLVSCGNAGARNVIGYYVPIATVSTEKEALEKIRIHSDGNTRAAAILEELRGEQEGK